jgi:hypothetical protein
MVLGEVLTTQPIHGYQEAGLPSTWFVLFELDPEVNEYVICWKFSSVLDQWEMEWPLSEIIRCQLSVHICVKFNECLDVEILLSSIS